MTLEKATAIINREIDGRLLNDPAELRDAQKLGIEAMKAVKRSRILWGARGVNILPGETVE